MGTLNGRGNHCGLWVAVFGPDGAGKSAVIGQLSRDRSLPFYRIQQFHFRPMFRRQWTDSPPATGPHAKPPRSMLISILKLLYWLADCWFGYMNTIRSARLTAQLVIYDRYLNDILIDPRRYRLPQSSLWFARLMVRLAPRPDLCLLLDVPSLILQQRKAEVIPAESQRQRQEYLEMFRLLPNALVVDAAAPVHEVAGEVKTAILRFRNGPPGSAAEVPQSTDADLAQRAFAALLQDSAAEDTAQEFLVVSAKGAPRWLVPAQPHDISPALACWAPYRWKSRAKWVAIRAAHRARMLPALPGVTRVSIPGVASFDWRSVGWNCDASPAPLVYVGTPGISRKAVIHLVNPALGVCDAIVKAPLTEAARAAILREADVLLTLADENYACAPQLLWVDQERGVAAQTALNGKAGTRKLTDSYLALLRSLMLPGESTTIAGHVSEWREQFAWAGEAGVSLITVALSEVCDPRPLPACWVHGDFAPWNIRHLRDGTLVLLDWEDAQRGGLPLQDAFHFLHMQDYLFGSHQSLHSTDVEPFAATIGISPQRCRKLEIAYLADSYLRRRAVGEAEHCEYVLDTLRLALQEKHRLPAPAIEFPGKRPLRLAPVTTSSQTSAIRSELFAAVIAHLNWAAIPYCVLSGQNNHAEDCSSDVDFIFHPRNAQRIAPLLARAARAAGAQLVQAMRHETSACYFVIAKEDGDEIGYLDPDCATDYRAHGRLWLPAEKILARRRRYKGFYIPAVPDEFAYYLIKKILKQSIAEFQLRRLRHLYLRDPASCREETLKFWPVATVRAVERALVESDLSWFQSHLTGLLAELKASDPVEALTGRVVQNLCDVTRVIGRVLRPTGMSVLVYGGEWNQRSAIAQALTEQLSPAFRRTSNMQLEPASATTLTSSVRLTAKIFAARLRSTLVVSSANSGKLFLRGLCPGPKWFARLFVRLLFRPDVIIVLTDEEGQTFALEADDVNAISATRKGRVILLNSVPSCERNSQQATRALLCFLATRQAKLLSLASNRSAQSSADRLAGKLREPAGLHLVVK